MSYIAKKQFPFTNSRWTNERRAEVIDFVQWNVLRYGTSQGNAPTKASVALSPHLANSIGCHNPEEFTSMVLGVQIDFTINWLLEGSRSELTIS